MKTEKKIEIGTIGYDPFVLRQFNKDFAGTNLSMVDKAKLLDLINVNYKRYLSYNDDKRERDVSLLDSEWDFCKYLVFSNTTREIKAQVAKIDLSIYPYIRTSYSSRTPDELPVMSRWAELPPGFSQPKANYIVCVLYSREQLLAEYDKKVSPEGTEKPEFYLPESVKYGIVAIMGTMLPEPDPLIPVTIMRNALGLEYGGNGMSINKEVYMKSVQFWDTHVMIK